MSEHECTCVVCAEEIAAYLSLPQQGLMHYATRFKNCAAFRGATLDGREVDQVFDAMLGKNGWAMFYQLLPCRGPNYETVDADGKPFLGKHVCHNHDEPCVGIKFGRVEMLLKDQKL